MLLVIQGKVDERRLQRLAAWKIVEGFRGTSEMPHVCDFYGLHYDEEIRDAEDGKQQQDIAEWYAMASKDLANFNWNKN